MLSSMPLLDAVNFVSPPGPGPDPSDDPQIFANLAKLSPHGQQTAFAMLVANPASTGLNGAARKDYFRYLGVVGVVGAVLGAGFCALVKHLNR